MYDVLSQPASRAVAGSRLRGRDEGSGLAAAASSFVFCV